MGFHHRANKVGVVWVLQKKTWQLQLCLLDSELNQSQLKQGRVSDAIQELEQKKNQQHQF